MSRTAPEPPPAQRDSSHSHGGSPLVPPSDSLRLLGSAPGIPWSVAAASSLEDFRATDGPSCTPLPTLAASAFLSSFSESSVENLPLSHQEAGAAGGLWVPQEMNILMEFNTIQCPFRGGAECCCSPLPSYPLGAKLKRHTLTPNNSAQPPPPPVYISSPEARRTKPAGNWGCALYRAPTLTWVGLTPHTE